MSFLHPQICDTAKLRNVELFILCNRIKISQVGVMFSSFCQDKQTVLELKLQKSHVGDVMWRAAFATSAHWGNGFIYS